MSPEEAEKYLKDAGTQRYEELNITWPLHNTSSNPQEQFPDGRASLMLDKGVQPGSG